MPFFLTYIISRYMIQIIAGLWAHLTFTVIPNPLADGEQYLNLFLSFRRFTSSGSIWWQKNTMKGRTNSYCHEQLLLKEINPCIFQGAGVLCPAITCMPSNYEESIEFWQAPDFKILGETVHAFGISEMCSGPSFFSSHPLLSRLSNSSFPKSIQQRLFLGSRTKISTNRA